MTTKTINYSKMHKNALEAEKYLKVFSNADRLALMCQLIQKELCVQDLETLTQIKQPTLSQQLTILRKNKIVQTRRDGKFIYYQLKNQHAIAMINLLYNQFCRKP
jgi:DNA-binding transcriptional ArsR family regulator